MINVNQLFIIYMSVLVLTFILFNLVHHQTLYHYYANLLWASLIASFVLAICFLNLQTINTDDTLLITLIILSTIFPLIVIFYLVCEYGQWNNKQSLCEYDIC